MSGVLQINYDWQGEFNGNNQMNLLLRFAAYRLPITLSAAERAGLDVTPSFAVGASRMSIYFGLPFVDVPLARSQPPARALPPGTYSDRRERVRSLKAAGHSLKQISDALREPIDTVKNDLAWLRTRGYHPK